VPTNQQRREAAKRKLQRQLARRDERDRARRQRLVIVGVVAAVLVISGGIWWVVSGRSSSTASSDTTSSTDASATETSPTTPTTPCSYPASGTAARPVTPPDNLSPLNTGTVPADLTINGSPVPITLDRSLAPCGVNAFLSLAQQGFYNDTTCHRLTVSGALNILQCGDPTGKGNGGPGYSFATEVAPTATYPVGTVALANAVGDTNGSQFFIVYGPTTLDPSYTILGTVGGDGMTVINQIAGGGTVGGGQEGAPNTTATIQTVTVPADALEGTGTYASETPSADATDLLPTDAGVATDTGAPTDTTAPAATDTAVPTTSGGAG
jgi:peptidyl-prolyl cis-trans isomerase B (cyclophilin B)